MRSISRGRGAPAAGWRAPLQTRVLDPHNIYPAARGRRPRRTRARTCLFSSNPIVLRRSESKSRGINLSKKSRRSQRRAGRGGLQSQACPRRDVVLAVFPVFVFYTIPAGFGILPTSLHHFAIPDTQAMHLLFSCSDSAAEGDMCLLLTALAGSKDELLLGGPGFTDCG